jgi:MFS family permease
MFAVAYAIFAIPSGKLGHIYGRKRVIRVALVAMTILSFILFYHAVFTRPPLLAPSTLQASTFERDILSSIPEENTDDRDFLLKVYKKEGSSYILDPDIKDDDRIKAYNIIKFTEYIPESIPRALMEEKILPRLSAERQTIVRDNYELKAGYTNTLRFRGKRGMRESLKEILNASIASSGLTLYSYWALLFIFGMFWVTVVTNSFPMLWQMATTGIWASIPVCITPSARQPRSLPRR